jgi:hypothetical protein
MPFSPDAEVIVKQLDNENWEVRTSLRYTGTQDSFEVPIGQGTDFASVPRPFVWFLPRYGSYTMAAILHDYLWRERASKGEMDWVDADGLFRGSSGRPSGGPPCSSPEVERGGCASLGVSLNSSSGLRSKWVPQPVPRSRGIDLGRR